jgi:hypothetical protein
MNDGRDARRARPSAARGATKGASNAVEVPSNADKRARPREQKNNRTDVTHDTPPVSSASRRAGRKD